MNEPQPILCEWTDDGTFKPASPVWAGRADKQFVVHERYLVEVRLERSEAAHRSYFASIREAHMNLPEDLAVRFPDAEALRKYALIRAGFADERSIVCVSHAEAERAAAFMRPLDSYAVIVVRDAVVTTYTAKSQNYRTMDKATFAESKRRVLDVIAGMLGVTPDDLRKASAA